MARRIVGLVLVVSGVPVALWGLFVATYAGDAGGNGDTYLDIAGRELDATPVGALALCAGVAVIATGAILGLRR